MNSKNFKFVDGLPHDAVEICEYAHKWFEDYYWSDHLNQCYFNNGVRIRIIEPNRCGTSEHFEVRCIDVTGVMRGLRVTKL